jgi:signal transduction histidine kinase
MNSSPGARRQVIVVTVASLCAATLLGSIASANHFNMMVGEGSPMPWRHALVMETPFWYVAALLTPALLWALRRLPDRSHGAPRIAEHLVIAAAWIVTHAVLEMGARYVLGTGLGGPQPTYVQMVHESLRDGLLGRILTYAGIVAIIYAFKSNARYRELDLAASQLEARLAEAQLRMLRMQLNPHFLFNAMNTVAMLTRAGRTSESVSMLLQLSALMRDALRGDAPDSGPLEDELSMLSRYVSVEQVRFGGKLAFEVNVPAQLKGATVPSFLLQPLVENAIRHGRASSDGSASVEVRAERADDRLILSVLDDGAGLSQTVGDSSGIGLRNVRDRLRQLYGTAQSFEIGHTDEGTVARISIPFATTTI